MLPCVGGNDYWLKNQGPCFLCVGLCAEEIHVCGEPAAIDFVRELMYTTGEEMEVRLGNIVKVHWTGREKHAHKSNHLLVLMTIEMLRQCHT